MQIRRGDSMLADELFTIEGVLADLHVAFDVDDVPARVGAPGGSTAIDDRLAPADDVARRAMCSHEDAQKFACLVGGDVVCGALPGVELLKAGHSVRVVVTRCSAVLQARAILDERQGYLWICEPLGARASVLHGRWSAFIVYLTSLAAFLLMQALFPDARLSLENTVAMALGMAALLAVVTFELVPGRHEVMDGSTQMFHLLGFGDPMNIDLGGYRLSSVHPRERRPTSVTATRLELARRGAEHVYCYRLAIEDGKLAVARP